MPSFPDDRSLFFAGLDPFRSKDLLRKPLGGGRSAVRKQTAQAPEEPPPSEPLDEESASSGALAPTIQSRPEVILRNPSWDCQEGWFNHTAKARVYVDLPEAYRHLTRIEFTLTCTTPEGRSEVIDRGEGHVEDGKASVLFTLYYPQPEDGRDLPDQGAFRFSARHKHSKELNSDALPVRKKSLTLKDIREILVAIEQEKGPETARALAHRLDYLTLCEMAAAGGADNDPNLMPTRFFLLPGMDDSALQSKDSFPGLPVGLAPHAYSVANLRGALGNLGFDCEPAGPFNVGLKEALVRFLEERRIPPGHPGATYVVKAGDSLGSIARRFGLPSWLDLFERNRAVLGENPNRILPGMQLTFQDPGTRLFEELVRQKGAIPRDYTGGLPYHYPWVLFSCALEDGDRPESQRPCQVTILDITSGRILHEVVLKEKRIFTALVPHSIDAQLEVGDAHEV